ncbi:MAG: PhoH family protein [Acutalibacteraceae bacterium]|nr:PhoH family protein [Acutalibacteraceae bacterium]
MKRFLLDTSVLIRTPDAMFRFEDNDVYICHTTLRELDELKGRVGDVGHSARECIRNVFELHNTTGTLINIPVGNGFFSVIEDKEEEGGSNSDVVVTTAKRNDMVLVTSDISMYLKAKMQHCQVEMFRNETVDGTILTHTGRRDVFLNTENISSLYTNKRIPLPKECSDMNPNEYAILKDLTGTSQSGIARRVGNELVLVRRDILNPYGIKARNSGQVCALDALMAPVDEIPLVFLIGPAGTAKTFLSMAAGLQQVEDKKYTRMLLLRPNIKFDDDIGYLKGDEVEKIRPLLRPCMDNLEALIAPTIESTEYAREKVNNLFSRGTVEGEALAYIRGRSIANNFVVVDEAQNATPKQMLGIISRVGAGTKIVVTGDPEQIDNPNVDKKNNGLVFAAERMAKSPLSAQIGFVNEECVRNPLAAEASKLLV